MSTRRSLWDMNLWGERWSIHVFYDVVADGTFIDIGPDSYTFAVEIWPFTLRVLYGPRWLERLPWKHPVLRSELRSESRS